MVLGQQAGYETAIVLAHHPFVHLQVKWQSCCSSLVDQDYIWTSISDMARRCRKLSVDKPLAYEFE